MPHAMTVATVAIVLLAVAAAAARTALGAEPSKVLWEIGKADGANAELALAPGGYAKFAQDAFFIVGDSDAGRDWPYVHPGPADGWASSRRHTFTVLFGLRSAPVGEAEAALEVSLLDTHRSAPPRLRITVNGRAFDRRTPPGAGDESIFGQPEKGKPHRFAIRFPASLLREGDNVVQVTTLEGSWMLYDAVRLVAAAGSGLEPAPVRSRTVVESVAAARALVEKDGRLFQPIRAVLRHGGTEAVDVTVSAGEGVAPVTARLARGTTEVELLAPAVSEPAERTVSVEVAGQAGAARTVTLKPVRKLTVYILPHSHTDIGYTEIQTAIEAKQVQNLVDGIAHAKRTAGYPAGARFVWNVEVLWAADLYLRRLDERQRADFLEAVKDGQVVLNGMYLNELTGLCRPEELVRLFKFATDLSRRTGTTIDSVMISDVPGYTWGTVSAMNAAGIRYFSTAPNYFDRIGTILREWENVPFYWVGPDGRSKVLVWIPFWGYAMSHRYRTMSPQLVEDFLDGLERRAYPYDVAYVRWSGHGDNAVPDPSICDFVRDWNARHAWPKFIISGTGEAFRALEQRYGDKLPVVRGDWTPYWEDGAGSSALETALNRQSSDRLAQAEALFAMRKPMAYPAADFEDAWNDVLLYSEHTWGADVSVHQPESQKTREQWEIKRSYALRADQRSRALLTRASEAGDDGRPAAGGAASAVDVVNTLSWPRTGLVTVGKELSAAGDRVTDDAGRPVPSQRLTGGELVFLAKDVPPFSTRRYAIAAGAPHVEGKLIVGPATLDNGLLRVRVDENGGIVELSAGGTNFAGAGPLNEYLYLPGDDLAGVQRNGPATIRPGEKGPLVASLIVESPAPGCNVLRREVRMTAGLDSVELHNLVDKARLRASSYTAREGKESVNFGFPFNVPDGKVLLDLPLGAMRVEEDQMPSACKNWFTVGRYADVSGAERGITWVTLDAPLVQVGGLTANFLNSQGNPDRWRKTVEPTQALYAWVMNNHWHTNYRAYQEGPTMFRFALRPHGRPDEAEASRFATGLSHPLLALPARGPAPDGKPLLRVEPAADVLVTGLKPSDDGKALIVRLYAPGTEARRVTVALPAARAAQMWLSDTGESRRTKIDDPIEIPGRGLVTLRIEP